MTGPHYIWRILTFAVILLMGAPNMSAKIFTIVIDAGHGGHDAGAVGQTAREKDINLGVALKLGELLSNQKGVKVIYTRTADKFVTLQGRADIANRAKGDLFISIHTNSLDPSAKNRSSVCGASVYTLGLDRSDDNLAVAMRENSVMKLENDYSTTYQGFDPSSAESYIIFEMSRNAHMQQSISAAREVMRELVSTAGRRNGGVKQANFWVLFRSAMPAMLIELDFICNPVQEKFLSSARGQKQLAEAIFKGVNNYIAALPAPKEKNEEKTSSGRRQKAENPSPTTASDNQAASDTRIIYKIQFLTSPRNLPAGSDSFRGLKPVEKYKERSTFKYTYGAYASEREAIKDLPKVRKLFPDAFVIKTRGGVRVP